MFWIFWLMIVYVVRPLTISRMKILSENVPANLWNALVGNGVVEFVGNGISNNKKATQLGGFSFTCCASRGL